MYSCSEEKCIDNADKQIACKSLSLPRVGGMKHHWIRGNLPLCRGLNYCIGVHVNKLVIAEVLRQEGGWGVGGGVDINISVLIYT